MRVGLVIFESIRFYPLLGGASKGFMPKARS